MSRVYRVEISGSFGANIVRIGQMGEQSRAHNIFRTLHALGAALSGLGSNVDVPTGVSALEKTLQQFDTGVPPNETEINRDITPIQKQA